MQCDQIHQESNIFCVKVFLLPTICLLPFITKRKLTNSAMLGDGIMSQKGAVSNEHGEEPIYRKVFKKKIIPSIAIIMVFGLSLYIFYVARHRPDPQGTIILGQTTLFADSHAALRILIRDCTNSRPIPGAQVRLAIEGQGIARELGSFVTGKDGSFSDSIYIPPVQTGKYKLIIDSRSKIGKDHIVKSIEVKCGSQVYLTTDKPVYQPGQTIHMRALVLNQMSLKPFADHPIQFEVSDPKGNKVFRANLISSKYGIASCDFELAREVNLGQYHIQVIADDVKAQKTVTVKRYVLPRFKIEVTTDKSFYLPFEDIKGSIKASYFFGKPVTRARVEVTGRMVFERPMDVFKITGTTDETGTFIFNGNISNYFRGGPTTPKNVSLDIEVAVKDSAGHEEITLQQCPIAQQPINIHVFPEGNGLVRGVENILYIMTAYPNGQPAVCELDINGAIHKSDETGITILKTEAKARNLILNITATDQDGRKGDLEERMRYRPREGFLLRTDKAVYKVGETIHATILSTSRNSAVFMDIIKNGQTVLTKALPTHGGQTEFAIDLPHELCGTLRINAYTFPSKRNTVMDYKLVHIRDTNQLRIETSLDGTVYKPGRTAKLNLAVTDKNGRSTPAALSLSAVDEAVFYVCENQPGFMEQFFQTNTAYLQPAYRMALIVSPADLLSGREKFQNLARVLFCPEAQEMDWSELMWTSDVEKDPRSWNVTRYASSLSGGYTLQAESNSEKLVQAKVFHHRHVTIPLYLLLILVILVIPLVMLGVLVHSVFSFLRIMTHDTVTKRTVNQLIGDKHVYLYALLALFPIITYLILLVVQALQGYDYGDFFDNGFLLVGIFVVGLPAVAIAIFPRILHFGTILQSGKFRGKGSFFMLLFAGLVLGVHICVVKAVLKETGEFFISLVSFLSFLLTLVLCLIAGVTSRKSQSRFYSSLGNIGRFILIVGLAETIILHVWILPVPLEPALRSMNKRFRKPTPRFFSNWSYGGYGGMGGYLGGSGIGGYGMGGMGESYVEVKKPPRIREYFPETLLWRPEVITDNAGRASLDVPLVDSITTWKMNVDAVSVSGRLGSSEVNIAVFQDFFIDVDMPVVLTRHDEISAPILCYNYLQHSQTIQLTLQPASWYEVRGPATQKIELAANDVKSVGFPIKVLEVGTHELVISAQGTSMSDAVQRRIEVRPNGVEVQKVQSGVLSQSVDHVFQIPPESIPDSHKLLLKLYPSAFSEVIEGLESIFRMPYGCFEQTSSVTYPNVMALLYMKRTNQITPEIDVKAKQYISVGYQRLLNFEIDGGGFDWFGRPPAEEKLTAYGILQLTDMSKVYDVDQAVIERASRWLLSRQRVDNSWDSPRDSRNLASGNADVSDTAYITWALAEAGVRGRKLNRALDFLRQNIRVTDKPYTIALAANAFLILDPNDPLGTKLISVLRSQFRIQGDTAYIPSSGVGAIYSRGRCLDIETTALSALAIIKVNPYADTVRKALTWLCEQKDQYGTWRSTQATILAMKALIAITNKTDSKGWKTTNVDVMVNGQSAGSIEISPDRRDLLHTVDLTTCLKAGDNDIRLTQDQSNELPYRLVGSYWVPQITAGNLPRKELEIQVDYNKERLAVDDILRCNVQITSRRDTPVNMAIIELGVPPGFRVDLSTFKELVASDVLSRYERIANQFILYIRSLRREKSLCFSYELRALYPIRAQIPSSKVYEYYQPENKDWTHSTEIVVEE